MIPNPMSLIRGKGDGVAKVEQLGVISVETLNQFHCNNKKRRLLSLFGTVYDVTSAPQSYGPDGAYKEYAGHDVTLALSMHKTEERWLDRFVKMKDKWIEDAKGWQEYFDSKYPVAGKLDKWENEDPATWPELTPEELEDIEKGCIIM